MPLTGIMDSAMITRGLAGIGFTIDEASSAYAILRGNVTPIINMPAALTTALAISLVPAISARMATKNYKGVRSASKMGMKLALIIGAPCAAGLYVLAEPIIRLLFTALEGQEIILAADLMKSCAVGVLFLSLVQTMTASCRGWAGPISCNQPGVWGNIEGYNYVDSHAHSHHKHTGRRDIHNNMLCGSRNLGYDLCDEKKRECALSSGICS